MAKIENVSRAFAWGLPAVVAAAFAGGLLAPEAQAQSATGSGANAPKNITTSGSNNTTVVTINNPTNGVSLNTYSNFDVYKNSGLVLNNCAAGASCATTASVLTGGVLGANGTTAANLIINQVLTGGSASQLNGQIETYGHAADLIIANPAGITCDGCGFINTPRATLTTGDPGTFDATNQNNITGQITVNSSNKVTIGSGGANISSLNYFDLIASSILVQGSIGTKNVTNNGTGETGLFAGANFDYNQRKVSGSTSSGGVAIDSSDLGGAYAGKIQLISTQAGAGVNTPDLQAGTGGIKLSADGKITVGDSGKNYETHSQGGIDIATTSGGDVVIANTVSAAGGLTLTAAGALTVNSGVTVGSAAISAGTSVTNNGTISSTGNSGSSIVAGTSVYNYGKVSSTSDGFTITAQSGSLINGDGTNAALIAGKTLKLAAAATLSNAVNSKLHGDTALNITSAQALANAGEISSGGTLDVSGTAHLTNTGQITAAGALTAGQSSDLTDLTNSGLISGGSLKLAATGKLDNQAAGQLTSTTGMTLSASPLNNDGTIKAGTSLDVTNSGNVTNTGSINAGTALGVSNTASLTNSGSISGNSVNVGVSGTLDNQASGKLASGTDMVLSAGTLANAGNINAGTTLGVTTSGNLTNSGQMTAQSAPGTGVHVGGDLTNTGQIVFQQDSTVNVGGTLTNGIAPLVPTNATIHAGGTLTVSATTLRNYGAADYLAQRGEISGAKLYVTTTGDVQNWGNLFGTQDVIVASLQGSVTNELGWMKAGNYLSISAAGRIDNILGLLQAPNADFGAPDMQNTVLTRLDDELLLPKRRPTVLRPVNAQDIVQAVTGWDKSVLAKFGTTDNKALDNLRLQLGDPFLMQQQQKQGKGASNLPQPGKGASAKNTGAAAGARPSVY